MIQQLQVTIYISFNTKIIFISDEEALRILTCTKNSRFSQNQRKNNSIIRNSFAQKMAGRASSKVNPNFDPRFGDKTMDMTLDSNRLR